MTINRDMVYAASLSYYAQMIAQGKMAVRPLGAHYELIGSSGVIGYKPGIENVYGLPVSLIPGGMSCDLIDIEMTEQSDNNQTKHVQANQQLGIIGSSLEHQVLEQLFATHGEQAFSAVKAIQLANLQGQKIYTITQDNYEEILPMLRLAPAAISDIRSAAQAGMTITTHEERIHVNGYTGEGYIITDPVTGRGYYMINGGMYGAALILAVLGTGILWSSMLVMSYGGLIYADIGMALALAGTSLIATGAFLLSGNKGACYAAASYAMWLIQKAMTLRLKKVFDWLFITVSIIIGIRFNYMAVRLCGCESASECVGL